MEYKRKAKLTAPLLSLNHVNRVIVKVTGYPRPISDTGGSKPGESPIMACPVIDLSSGEEMQLITFAVILSTFGGYGDSLPGKCFEIIKREDQDKGYLKFDIYEIEEEHGEK